MPIEATVTQRSGASPIAILTLRGEVDIESAQELDDTLEALLRVHERLVLDLFWTSYVCSAGWRLFILRGSRGPQPGIKVAGMNQTVRDVYELLGFAQVMDAHETVDAAVAAFGPATSAPVDPSARS